MSVAIVRGCCAIALKEDSNDAASNTVSGGINFINLMIQNAKISIILRLRPVLLKIFCSNVKQGHHKDFFCSACRMDSLSRLKEMTVNSAL